MNMLDVDISDAKWYPEVCTFLIDIWTSVAEAYQMLYYWYFLKIKHKNAENISKEH